MQTLKFKTNINCGNCINAISPTLNQEIDIEQWQVDTDNPDKVLSVVSDLSPVVVETIIKNAGFEAELIEN